MVSSNLFSVLSALLPLISALYPLNLLYGLVEHSQKLIPNIPSVDVGHSFSPMAALKARHLGE